MAYLGRLESWDLTTDEMMGELARLVEALEDWECYLMSPREGRASELVRALADRVNTLEGEAESWKAAYERVLKERNESAHRSAAEIVRLRQERDKSAQHRSGLRASVKAKDRLITELHEELRARTAAYNRVRRTASVARRALERVVDLMLAAKEGLS